MIVRSPGESRLAIRFAERPGTRRTRQAICDRAAVAWSIAADRACSLSSDTEPACGRIESVGSKGDSYDNALAELDSSRRSFGREAWRTLEDFVRHTPVASAFVADLGKVQRSRYKGMILSRSGRRGYPGQLTGRTDDSPMNPGRFKASGYVGCYTQVKEYVRKVRPRVPEEPAVRFETPPGHQGQVDFADFRLPWGKRYAFLVVLGFSRVLWLQFFTRQTMQHVFEGLEAAFSFFGGVPHELLFDQMKAVVTKDERAAGGRRTENAEFLRFAHHWNFRIRACRPYRAKTKGKVERPVSYVRSSFFYGRTFTSDEDLNRQARHWLDHVANVRTHGTLKERPADRFEHERDLLRPLASRPYRSLVLPPEVIQQAKAVLPRIDVERRSLEAYAQVAGGVR